MSPHPVARPFLAAALIAAMLTPALTDPSEAQATMRRIEPGVLTAEGCATHQITGHSSRRGGYVIIGRAQSSAERAWRDAVREAGYHGQPFQDWRRARNIRARCFQLGSVTWWACSISGTPCNPRPDRVNRPNDWQR